MRSRKFSNLHIQYVSELSKKVDSFLSNETLVRFETNDINFVRKTDQTKQEFTFQFKHDESWHNVTYYIQGFEKDVFLFYVLNGKSVERVDDKAYNLISNIKDYIEDLKEIRLLIQTGECKISIKEM